MSEAIEVVRSSPSEAISAVLDLFHDRSYLTLLGKSVGTGIAVGTIGRRLPAVAVPVALLGGMYLGLELARWITQQHEAEEIGPYIEATSLEASDERPAVE